MLRPAALSADEFDLIRDDLEVGALLAVFFIGLVVRDAGQQDAVSFLQVLLPPDGELVPADDIEELRVLLFPVVVVGDAERQPLEFDTLVRFGGQFFQLRVPRQAAGHGNASHRVILPFCCCDQTAFRTFVIVAQKTAPDGFPRGSGRKKHANGRYVEKNPNITTVRWLQVFTKGR